jgi:hypothetical protein
VPDPVVTYFSIMAFSSDLKFVIQPGLPVPGGADININLDVALVSIVV